MMRVGQLSGCLLAIGLTVAGSSAADTVLCKDLTTPPGAVYMFGDAPTATELTSPFIHFNGEDYLVNGTLNGGGASIFGVATRGEAVAQAVRDALAPDHLTAATGTGFVAQTPTPSVARVPGPTEAVIDQFIAEITTAPGVNEFATNQINNSNKSVFQSPSCGIGCCYPAYTGPKVSHFTSSALLMRFNGNISGCGIMIVDGDLTVSGTFDFQGLLIVRGTLTVATDEATGLAGWQTTYGSIWTNGLSLTGNFGMVARYSSDVLSAWVKPLALPSCQTSSCGDGIVTYDEECDDGNVADGDCCTSQCTLPTSCDDGDLCTENDHCEDGVCTGNPVTCGHCQACDANMGCHPALAENCRHSLAPWADRLDIRHGADASGDRFKWQLRRGESTPASALGDPFDGDGYTLCVFGQRGRHVVLGVEAPAGGACGNGSCWSHRGPAGVRYRDWAARDGLASLQVDANPNGKSKVVVQGRGTALGLPPLPLPLPLTVQLQAGAGACWEATYEADDVVQDQLQLRARGSR